ncbi:hypothetical protein H5398_00580 [Tessaracoccus sp. MC1679]|uniref:hypothetical protein n=1 Tax=Tessaracoccus sp. MC1679 TaxID=2760313 RepID=UPI0016021C6A|nr:hypothetical protein [Tessaracoccus sp. MC1679]MBB1514478.1 hypothetical protein [Tessaracoccus sp. MC1679]
MSEPRKPRRPALRAPSVLDEMGESVDPVAELHAAHATAATLVGAGRQGRDPELTARLIGVVDEVGITTLADLWASRPARSLPGALYRLYVLREWVRRDADIAARQYSAGTHLSESNHAIAGADPTGPDEVLRVADDILRGVFEGDLALALERAGAFARVVSAGRGNLQPHDDVHADRLMHLAEDLAASARLWRRGELE